MPTDGTYTFYTSSDDGSQLLIGNRKVVDNDGLHGPRERSGSIGLKAGKHSITVLYFDKTEQEVLNVSYAGPGIAKKQIPANALLYNSNSTSRLVSAEQFEQGSYLPDQTLVFPNPAKNYVTIRVYADEDGEVSISVTDVLARRNVASRHAVQAGYNDISLRIGHLTNGVHAVTIENGPRRVVKALVVGN